MVEFRVMEAIKNQVVTEKSVAHWGGVAIGVIIGDAIGKLLSGRYGEGSKEFLLQAGVKVPLGIIGITLGYSLGAGLISALAYGIGGGIFVSFIGDIIFKVSGIGLSDLGTVIAYSTVPSLMDGCGCKKKEQLRTEYNPASETVPYNKRQNQPLEVN